MSFFSFLRKNPDGSAPLPSLSQLQRLQGEVALYLSEHTQHLTADAERLLALYRAQRLCDALEVEHTMTARTAELATLEHIKELLDTFLSEPLPDPATPTYYVSPLFLAGLITRLLPAEKMALLSGAQLGEHLFTIDTGVPLKASATTTYISPTVESRAAAIDYFWHGGCKLHVITHTHPGDSPGAVWPSDVDTKTLDRLQKNHHPVIGLVACEGGFFRAYSEHRPFELVVVGEGVELLDPASHLYRVSPDLLADAVKLNAFISPLSVRAISAA